MCVLTSFRRKLRFQVSWVRKSNKVISVECVCVCEIRITRKTENLGKLKFDISTWCHNGIASIKFWQNGSSIVPFFWIDFSIFVWEFLEYNSTIFLKLHGSLPTGKYVTFIRKYLSRKPIFKLFWEKGGFN